MRRAAWTSSSSGVDGRLDYAQGRQIEAFARDYLGSGQGAMQIAMPAGPVNHAAAERTLIAVRRTLLRNGVRNGISIVSYPIADPALASSLHLSYVTCRHGRRRGAANGRTTSAQARRSIRWENRTYYNFGCANQTTLAAQVANPRDLVQPRAEDPTDVQLRTRAIGLLRTGTDPSTIWTNSPPLIGPVGGF